MSMFTTPTQVIEKLGGPAEVAALLNRPYSTVFSWQHREVIPPSAWADLVKVGREKRVKGLTFEALAALPKQPSKRRRAA